MHILLRYTLWRDYWSSASSAICSSDRSMQDIIIRQSRNRPYRRHLFKKRRSTKHKENKKMENENEKHTPAIAIAFAWFLVGIPLAWGVYQTFVKSLALFQ